MKKIPVSCGIVALLVLAGCMSGMYSSDVSVDHRDDGVSDYTIVESLDVVEFPESMPVVVESRSSTKKGNNELSQFLWLCTLGVVPGFFMEAAIEDVTVKTPLGEMSGSSTVEACYWMGWLPIFLPYPGVADERSSYPQLPNHALENAAHERLVANLVSQFSKEEYKRYAAAHNTPEARATREKKHAEQRRIEEESKRIAEENAKAEAERLVQARRKKKLEFSEREWADKINASVSDQLSQVRRRETHGQKWFFSPLEEPVTFLDESDSDMMAGESLLSDFGMKFLPNAYADYEKKREAAFELEQVFNETFPKAWTIKNGDPQWEAMHKVLERYVRLREEYRWSRDALAYYWYLQKLGVMNSSDLAKVDTAKLTPRLLPFQQNVGALKKAMEEANRYSDKGICMYFGMLELKSDKIDLVGMTEDERTFAAKYAPEAYAIFQNLEQAHKEGVGLFEECLKARMLMDNGRYSEALVMQERKNDEIAKKMNEIARALKAWRTEHRTTLKSSEDVAKCDQELAKKVKPFVTALPDYVKTRVLGLVIPEDDMVEISNMKYRMQRTNVTQLQWMIVMGDDPVDDPLKQDPRKAVLYWREEESVLKFLRCVREMDGRKYRIPTFEMIDSLTDNKQQRTWPYHELVKVGLGNAREDGLFDLENMRDLCIHLDTERSWEDLWPRIAPDKRPSPDFSGIRLCLDDGSVFWTETEKRLYKAISQGEAFFQKYNNDRLKDRLEDLRRLAVFFE